MGRDRPRSRPAFGPSAPPQSNRRLIMRSDIEVGAQFPDYELSDHAGEQRKLSEAQGTNMMVLHLARGGYDPKEHRFLRHFADAYPDIKTGVHTAGRDYNRQPTRRQRVSGRRRSRVAILGGS